MDGSIRIGYSPDMPAHQSLKQRLFFWVFSAVFLVISGLQADGPGDNRYNDVRRIPPPGIPVPVDVREKLESRLNDLFARIQELRRRAVDDSRIERLLPDVEIFYKAVDWALRYDQFYKNDEFEGAMKVMEVGLARAEDLANGRAPWLRETGNVVRAYRSKIDASIQPYGMVVPPGFEPGDQARRLDFWFHGRGETLSELQFILQRMSNSGQFVPVNAFVLHPYGRYCNANKFAGEIDLFEALDHARRDYTVDENRILVRGFSMGGAACWQFAAHYPGHWAAAAPGAGFSETYEFLKFFQGEDLDPLPWERKLWHLYDCTDYAVNFFNLPVVAYSGEKDRQKQAADIMESAMARENIRLTHIVGKDMGHKYDQASATEIERRLGDIARRGRDPFPHHIRFATYTLRYNRSHWISLDALSRHWDEARIEAVFTPGKGFDIKTSNIEGFSIDVPPGYWPDSVSRHPAVVIDGQQLTGPLAFSDRSYAARFVRSEGQWLPDSPEITATSTGLRKKPGLQGPIDDAFMDRFIIVRPTGNGWHAGTREWISRELDHAIDHWRLQFRGIPQVVADTALSQSDFMNSNLILFGDPAGNAVLSQILDKLLLEWDRSSVKLGERKFDSASHVPAMIFPNPYNPEKYVVLNTGFTYREYDYLNNARQIPRLPDYAIYNIQMPGDARRPAPVAHAGFFTDSWEIPGAVPAE